MESLLSTFHVEWGLFIAQVVNFAIVVLVLWYFAFRPLNTLLEKRRSDIKDGLEKAKEAESALVVARSNAEILIKKATEEATAITAESYDQAQEFSKQMVQEALVERLKIVAGAEKDIAEEKDKALSKVKEKSAELIVMGVEKILREKFNTKTQEALIADLIK